MVWELRGEWFKQLGQYASSLGHRRLAVMRNSSTNQRPAAGILILQESVTVGEAVFSALRGERIFFPSAGRSHC